MRNIIKDVEQNCKECCNPEKTVEFLYGRGDFSYTSEFYREVWFFYKESLALFPKGKIQKQQAREHTCELMRISERTFWKISNKMRKKFKG